MTKPKKTKVRRVVVTIEIVNDDFQPEPGPELARIFSKLAARIDEQGFHERPIRDRNGNVVGEIVLKGAKK